MALKTCCCGCSVKTGALIVGYFYSVLSAIGVFLCVLATIGVGEISKYVPDEDEDKQIIQETTNVLSKVYLMGAVICLKTLFINRLLIHGIKQTKPALVMLWTIFYAAGMVIKICMSYAAIGLAAEVPTAAWYGVISGSTILFCIELYSLIVVSSHYHEMKKPSLLDEEQFMHIEPKFADEKKMTV